MSEDNDKTPKPKDVWDKLEVSAKVAGAILIPFVIAVATRGYNTALKDRDANLRLVELSIQILREKQPGTEDADQLRDWAVRKNP
jgi:hypothetical protein